MANWNSLAPELRFLILEALLRDGCSLANAATVSREWQNIIEPHVFARIRLTPKRLQDLNLMSHRNRYFVGYMYLCIKLEEYDCPECENDGPELLGTGCANNSLIVKTFRDLLSALGTWEPKSDLLLDISIYSPSDSEHWFKYLTFEPDISIGNLDQYIEEKVTMLRRANDNKRHGWNGASRESLPDWLTIEKLFNEIMDEGPFDTDEEEFEWWKQLPSVPAVTGVLLRQQNRRRWRPAALAQLLTRFPGLKEIHYEPWREWDRSIQNSTDGQYQTLFESLASHDDLKRLVVFENFNQDYTSSIPHAEVIRTPAPAVSRAVAIASLRLESLSASFIVDAMDFFLARHGVWKWPSLTSLTLTSNLLLPDTSVAEASRMLKSAAAAAMTMPRLETMELWNGRRGLAALFQYRRGAGITWRGTWDISLEPDVIQAWEGVAIKHRSHGPLVFTKDILDFGTNLESHGDAIKHLKLINPVLRPISLQQIQIEHKMRAE